MVRIRKGQLSSTDIMGVRVHYRLELRIPNTVHVGSPGKTFEIERKCRTKINIELLDDAGRVGESKWCVETRIFLAQNPI